MKKILLLSLIALLAACGNEEAAPKDEVKEVDKVEEVEPVTVEPTEVSEHPFPSNAEPVGSAMITVKMVSGDSADGNVPVLFVSESDSAIQIGVDYDEFDGSKETFVYINEMFYTTEQVGERSSGALTLSEGNLEPGEYTVTAVQFEGNDPNNAPINFTQAKFKIEKSS